jgi:hypothetical protein
MRRIFVFLITVALPCGSSVSYPKLAAQQSPANQANKYAEKLRAFEAFVRRQMEKDKIPSGVLNLRCYKISANVYAVPVN